MPLLKAIGSIVSICVLLCFASCRTAPEARLPSGTVDLPRENDVLRGHQVFYGWAVSEDRIKSVNVYIDRDFLAYANLGVSRPDVNKLLPGFPSGDNAGWRLDLEAQNLPAGVHQLVFEAKTSAGAVGWIGTRSVTIVH